MEGYELMILCTMEIAIDHEVAVSQPECLQCGEPGSN
jgi:hypothetical protein